MITLDCDQPLLRITSLGNQVSGSGYLSVHEGTSAEPLGCCGLAADSASLERTSANTVITFFTFFHFSRTFFFGVTFSSLTRTFHFSLLICKLNIGYGNMSIFSSVRLALNLSLVTA